MSSTAIREALAEADWAICGLLRDKGIDQTHWNDPLPDSSLAKIRRAIAAIDQAQQAAPPFGSKRAAALALYEPPFTFRHGYIYDGKHRMVADQDGFEGKVTEHVAARVRGWGRIGYLPDAATLQDEVGNVIAEALTAFWQAAAAPQAPEAAQPGVSEAKRAGIELAAAWVDKRRDDFDREHGSIDPETGTLEYGRGAHAEAKHEYSSELAEIADGIRALAAQAGGTTP